MPFLITLSASTCTASLGYTPASLGERVVGVVGRFEFQTALHSLRVAVYFATTTLPQQVPTWMISVPRPASLWLEPEGRDDKRNFTVERAVRIASINSTASNVAVRPGTGELMWKGFPPEIAVSTKRNG